jgi:hypothetical protein
MKAILWLVLLAMLSTAIQPALAARFSIFVYDNGDPVQNALIRVWEKNNLVDDGNTDSNGMFVTTKLFDGVTYRIRGQTYNKWEEIDYLAESANSTEIKIYLHT